MKFVATRDQGFTIATFRAETRQHVKLAAEQDGKLVSFFHEGWELTSRPSGYNVAGVDTTARMYACENIATAVNVVHADRNTPGFQRAPAETPYMFGLECAMDELAYALNMDPIELRRVNDTQIDPVSGLTFSSRSLMPCFDQAAERFGWKQARNPKPRSMRDGDWLIGYGCAAACYPTNIGPGAARLSLTPDGKATMGLAAHEIGTGAYTTIAITVARALGLKVEDVTVHLGDSDLPPIPVAGGSNNAASTTHVGAQGLPEALSKPDRGGGGGAPATARSTAPIPPKLRLETALLKGPDGTSEPLAERPCGASAPNLRSMRRTPPGPAARRHGRALQGPADDGARDRAARTSPPTLSAPSSWRCGCTRTREVRAPRIVSAFAAGNIINPLTAYSQLMGGAIWGLSSALHEATELDLPTLATSTTTSPTTWCR